MSGLLAFKLDKENFLETETLACGGSVILTLRCVDEDQCGLESRQRILLQYRWWNWIFNFLKCFGSEDLLNLVIKPVGSESTCLRIDRVEGVSCFLIEKVRSILNSRIGKI